MFNKKVYDCTDDMGCGCPRLLCTGFKECDRRDENPIKCQLTKAYEKIDLQNAKLEFFVKGDCKCNSLGYKPRKNKDKTRNEVILESKGTDLTLL